MHHRQVLSQRSLLAILILVLATLWLSGGNGAFAAELTTKSAGASGTIAGVAISVSPANPDIVCYDFVEVSLRPLQLPVGNPFTETSITGQVVLADQAEKTNVEGFCDAADGSVYRLRFMPTKPGDYTFTIRYQPKGEPEQTIEVRFPAKDAKRRGPVRVDAKYPWHFVWEGTGEHYYLNGTTAFFLMGWDDDKVINAAIDRLAGYDVNRIRVLLDGRSDHTWTEPIKSANGFHLYLNPWPAARPDDLNNPGFDYTRFNVAYWQRFERMVAHARDKNVIISAILGWNDTKARPKAGSDDEKRYFRYAAARLGAFSNITWDMGDDCDGFRSDANTHEMGEYIEQMDPNHHLATSHPMKNVHQDRAAAWFGMTSFQQWDRPSHKYMLAQRAQQAKTGRIIPQVNEEYGYEDHYPDWAPYKPPGANADADRRAAWEMGMAGCYQTTGETAKRGTGTGPDTGGGWVNGRGDNTMTMLAGYQHMVRFFTSLEWWKAEPHDELVTDGAFCLADPGNFYVVYVPKGGSVTVTLANSRYDVLWYNPRTGKYPNVLEKVAAVGPVKWTAPTAADHEDWVLLIKRSEP